MSDHEARRKQLADMQQRASKQPEDLFFNVFANPNYYPVEEAKNSNLRHRPIGIGVQGLADTFILMRQAFDSPEAKKLNAEK